jgi:uncharacterized protein YjiS (DUF1127 family)
MIIVEAILSVSALMRGRAAQSAARSVVRTFKRCRAACMAWQREWRAIAELSSMSDRDLRDIGVNRCEILGAVRGDTARERASVSNAMPGSFAVSRPGESGIPQAMAESRRTVPRQRSDSVRASTTFRHGNIEHDVCHRSISAVAAQIRDYLAALERGHRTIASSPTQGTTDHDDRLTETLVFRINEVELCERVSPTAGRAKGRGCGFAPASTTCT